ncbi:hypothetical protein SLEP1_g21393 [Rubroshorea leprosula]|nr:hypothetical protein SLEP1_g21393 [Rubroshorea leprosula]
MTYMLLIGAFFLDVFAVISHVSSNWQMLDPTIRHNKVHKFISCLRFFSSIHCGEDKKEIAFIAQQSFIKYCLHTEKSLWPKIVRLIDTEDTFAKFRWTTWEPVNDDLKKFIYSSLKQKQEKYRESKFEYEKLSQLLTGKGKSVLIREGVLEKIQILSEKFQRSIEDEEFSQYLLLWHIATSLLFHTNHGKYTGSYYRISKLLSDYMMYLLLLRPNMLPKGIGEERIRETRDEVINFLNKQSSQTESEAGDALFNNNVSSSRTDKRPDGILVQSKSVLQDGRKLAHQLEGLVEEEELTWDHEEKWKMIADVWMEMLVFAASKCEWREHKTQMKNGKELLTHVALLMVHFGLTGHVQVVDIQSNQVEPVQPQEDRSSRWDWELSHLPNYLV